MVSHRSPGALARACLIWLASLVAVPLVAGSWDLGRAAAAEAIQIRTTAGVREGTRILRVTTLANDGPGSLREALTASGPRIVVFEVSGYVDLTSRIDITSPYLTVAGQTAPDPGIVVRGRGLVLRTHDVRFEHFAVYPSSVVVPGGRPQDALALVGRSDRHQEVRRVVLRNMTFAHASDENLSLAGDAIGEVLVESSLIAKGLRQSGHPSGQHSRGLLIYRDARDIAIVGNILANNQRRNPVFSVGTKIVVANNLIYGFASNAINVQLGRRPTPMMASVVGNVAAPTVESACVGPVRIRQGTPFEANPDALLYLSDNILDERHAAGRNCDGAVDGQRPDPAHLAAVAPVVDPDWPLLPASEVRAFVLAHAGMRPARRPPMDAAIIRGVADGTGRIIDRVEDDGGWPDARGTTRRLDIPVADAPSAAELPRLQAWLCGQHFAVGGIANSDCRSP